MFEGITIEEFKDLDLNQMGVCTECGAERECCEPDAREYNCEDCGAMSVYGAQELLVMGLVS